MGRWPVSDRAAREMYMGGRGNETAKWYARLWGRVFALGLFPRRWVTLEVPGRRTGRPMRVPLGMADVAGRWYLVSMLGECNWVRNARAAGGRVVLHRVTKAERVLVEVPVAERGPILRRYVGVAAGGRPHIPVPKGAPVEEFQVVADRYPVFAVYRATPTGCEPVTMSRLWPRSTVVAVLLGVVAMSSAVRRASRRMTAAGHGWPMA